MLYVTTETIPGKQIEVMGLVKGSSVQCKHIGKDIGSSFKTIIGGEMKAYTQMMDDARNIATERMLQEAAASGADAIVSVRYATSAILQGAAEVMAYGTAVKFVG